MGAQNRIVLIIVVMTIGLICAIAFAEDQVVFEGTTMKFLDKSGMSDIDLAEFNLRFDVSATPGELKQLIGTIYQVRQEPLTYYHGRAHLIYLFLVKWTDRGSEWFLQRADRWYGAESYVMLCSSQEEFCKGTLLKSKYPDRQFVVKYKIKLSGVFYLSGDDGTGGRFAKIGKLPSEMINDVR